MDLPLDARVHCIDGLCGRSTHIVLKRTTQSVTHVVVKEDVFLQIERLVPLDLVAESTPRSIHLNCTKAEFGRLDYFMKRRFVSEGSIESVNQYEGDEEFLTWPYLSSYDERALAEYVHVAPNEVAVCRDAFVHATDGRAGRVDGFLVSTENGAITHLVLRMGHLWWQKDVSIPVTEIKRIEEHDIYLKLDRQGVDV